MSAAPRPRPKYYDLNLAHLPAPGILSIFHRVSGVLLFFPILPGVLCILSYLFGTEADYARIRDVFAHPLVKLATIGFIWLYAHHFFAGIRYLLLDVHVGIAKAPARTSALLVFAAGILTTLIVAWRLW